MWKSRSALGSNDHSFNTIQYKSSTDLLGLCCWLIVGPSWWLLHLLSLRHLIMSHFSHKKTAHLIQVPHLVMTENCWRWSTVTSLYTLLCIKLGNLEPLRESSSGQQWSRLYCCNSPWYYHKYGAAHVQYMLHGWGGVHFLQLLKSPNHSYIYFIDYCWLLIAQNFKTLLKKVK